MSDINAGTNQVSVRIADAAGATAQPDAPTATPQETGTNTSAASSTAGATTTAGSEQLALLHKIDSDIGALSTKIDDAQKLSVRNGAIAGGVSGAVSGGIVALGLQFVRHKLGF